MADLSKFTLPSGTTYNIKDEVARSMAGGGIRFLGVTDTVITDESTVATVQIDEENIEVQNGDLVIFNKKEFVYSANDSCWHELGDNSAFSSMAYADSASASYTPAGTITGGQFQGTLGNINVTGTPEGSVAISKGEGATNYTPEGTISKPDVTVNLNTSTGFVASSANGGGAVTAGTAAQATMPQLEFTVTGETLAINWTEGSFTPNEPTQVVMPSFEEKTIASGVQSAALDTAPVFTGTGVDLEATFTGDSMNATGTYTPEGNISDLGFSGTQATITVNPDT